MRPLLRSSLKAIIPTACKPFIPDSLVQESLGGCPWRIAVASMLLCRAPRRKVEPVLLRLLALHPGPEYVCRALDLDTIIRPCGIHRSRARQIARFSSQWLSNTWTDLRELSGVGLYVVDSVGTICLGWDIVDTADPELKNYALGCGKDKW